MADRKKVDKKPIPKLEPKKRETTPLVIKKDSIQVVQESKPKRKSVNDDKYVRLAINSDLDKRREFYEKVQRGDLKLAYYAIDNEIGYHYYIVIKK